MNLGRTLVISGSKERQIGNLEKNSPHLPRLLPKGLPVDIEELRSYCTFPLSYGRTPNANIRQDWLRPFKPNGTIIDSQGAITGQIIMVRERVFDHDQLVIHPSAQDHFEAIDFTNPTNLHDLFFYLENPSALTERRISMLTDLTLFGVRKKLEEKGKESTEPVVVVDFGPGPFPLEKMLRQRLSKDERKRVKVVALDVSEDLLRYGLSSEYIQQGVVADMSKISTDELKALLPKADVVIYAEILEHLFHSSVVFRGQILPWIKQNEAILVGSVPNAVQLADLSGLITGSSSPHQLRRPIFDRNNDHHSFFTASSLDEFLGDYCQFKDYGIVSNGVRLQQSGDQADIEAGITYPQGGDRLVFWTSN